MMLGSIWGKGNIVLISSDQRGLALHHAKDEQGTPGRISGKLRMVLQAFSTQHTATITMKEPFGDVNVRSIVRPFLDRKGILSLYSPTCITSHTTRCWSFQDPENQNTEFIFSNEPQ